MGLQTHDWETLNETKYTINELIILLGHYNTAYNLNSY